MLLLAGSGFDELAIVATNIRGIYFILNSSVNYSILKKIFKRQEDIPGINFSN